jgi:C-terminal processing protease CtpA/Prc
MWKTVDAHYSYFDYKHINWDSVQTYYKPMVTDSIKDDSLYHVLSNMLAVLQDGHVNLTTDFDRSRYWKMLDEPPSNFNENFLMKHYWKANHYRTGALLNQLIDSVGYIYYESFGNEIANDQLDYVLNRFQNTKGLILDIRNNGGGSIKNVFSLLSRLIDTTTVFGTSYYKNGPQHQDFDKGVAITVEPINKAYYEKQKKEAKKGKTLKISLDKSKKESAKPHPMYLKKPIVLLINSHCYSASTFFAGFMSTLPNVTLVGDKTGGGGGLPISSELPNGWRYRFSGTYTTLPDGFNIERGVPADIPINTGAADELQGKDRIIEQALELILKKKRI